MQDILKLLKYWDGGITVKKRNGDDSIYEFDKKIEAKDKGMAAAVAREYSGLWPFSTFEMKKEIDGEGYVINISYSVKPEDVFLFIKTACKKEMEMDA